MKKLLAAFVALVIVAAIFGCADDIILPEDEPIEGRYYGTYKVIENYGGAEPDTIQNFITWIFTETNYIMQVDTDSIKAEQECFCYTQGQYSLTDGIRLKQLSWNATGSPPEECTSCDENHVPTGVFQRQVSGKVLILRSIDNANNIFHELRLTRIAEEEEE